MRIICFEIGRAHDDTVKRAFESLKIKYNLIPLKKINRVNLMRYDILLILSYSNQDILKSANNKIKNFITKGGIAIILGASADKTKWIPFCKYYAKFLNKIKFKNLNYHDTQILFDDLEIKEDFFKYHSKFISHGYYTSNKAISLPFITGEQDNSFVLSIIKPRNTTGQLLITTLDPEYHATIGYARRGRDFDPNADKLFNNILKWAIRQAENQPKPMKIIKFLYRLLTYNILEYIVIGLLWFLIIAIIGKILNLISSEVFEIIVSIISIVSFIYTLLIIKNKMKEL